MVSCTVYSWPLTRQSTRWNVVHMTVFPASWQASNMVSDYRVMGNLNYHD